jgi:hypothetical protein
MVDSCCVFAVCDPLRTAPRKHLQLRPTAAMVGARRVLRIGTSIPRARRRREASFLVTSGSAPSPTSRTGSGPVRFRRPPPPMRLKGCDELMSAPRTKGRQRLARAPRLSKLIAPPPVAGVAGVAEQPDSASSIPAEDDPAHVEIAQRRAPVLVPVGAREFVQLCGSNVIRGDACSRMIRIAQGSAVVRCPAVARDFEVLRRARRALAGPASSFCEEVAKAPARRRLTPQLAS